MNQPEKSSLWLKFEFGLAAFSSRWTMNLASLRRPDPGPATQAPGGRLWLKIGLVVLGLGVAVCLWLYFAGAILLQLVHRNPNDAQFLTFYQYWFYYGANLAVKKKLYIAGGLGAAPLVLVGFLVFKPKKPKQYGETRFANNAEIKKAGLHGENGLIVGQKDGELLMYGGDAHAAIDAETRSGKGVAVCIPNALNWKDSMVANDPKQELFDITSGYRAKYGQQCFLFNPTARDYRTHRWNPLGYISDDPNFRIDDIQKIAAFIFPDIEGADPIWTGSARSLMLGAILYLIETPGLPVTFSALLRLVTQDEEAGVFFKRVIAERVKAGKPLSGVCMSALNDFIATPEKTRGSIRKTLTSRFELFYNPLVEAATSTNDFDFRDLRRKRMSLYIGIMPGDLDRLGGLLNLFWQQLIDCNTMERPEKNKALKYKVMLLMDELTACGRIAALLKGVAYLAGYGLKVLGIYHSEAQLRDVYGDNGAEAFARLLGVRIMFSPAQDDPDRAEKISKMLGDQTWKVTSKGKSTSGGWRPGSRSENTTEQARPLMLPQEVRRIGMWKQFIFIPHLLPIFCDKVRYFMLPVFVNRLKEISPSLAALGKALPTKDQLDDAASKGELRADVPLLKIEHTEYVFAAKPTVTEAKPDTKEPAAERPLNAADVEAVNSLTADDFSCDFSDIEVPSEKPTDAELQAAADQLLVRFGFKETLNG